MPPPRETPQQCIKRLELSGKIASALMDVRSKFSERLKYANIALTTAIQSVECELFCDRVKCSCSMCAAYYEAKKNLDTLEVEIAAAEHAAKRAAAERIAAERAAAERSAVKRAAKRAAAKRAAAENSSSRCRSPSPPWTWGSVQRVEDERV